MVHALLGANDCRARRCARRARGERQHTTTTDNAHYTVRNSVAQQHATTRCDARRIDHATAAAADDDDDDDDDDDEEGGAARARRCLVVVSSSRARVRCNWYALTDMLCFASESRRGRIDHSCTVMVLSR